MQLPAWITRHPWLVALGVCVLVGAATGWLTNTLPPPSGRLATNARWQLPDKDVLDRYHAADFQKLVQSAAWQAPPDAGMRTAGRGGNQQGGQAASWKLVGIVTGAGSYALVTVAGGGKTLRLKAGDKLPNGDVIKHVDKKSISIQSANCVQRLPLFPLPGAAKPEACTPAAGGKPPEKSAGETHA